MAGGALFQVDQALSSDKVILRHPGERREEPDPDCGVVHVTVAIIRKHLKIGEIPHTILQIPGLTISGKTSLNQPSDTTEHHIQPDGHVKQLNLFFYRALLMLGLNAAQMPGR